MASAIYGMSVMVGPTVGPTLGGYLTDTLGWRSIFNINLPIGIVVAILSYLLVEEVGYDAEAAKKAPAVEKVRRRSFLKPKDQRKPVDSIGLSLLVVGVGCLQFVLERGHAEDWFDSNAIILCTILAIGSLVGLIWWELKRETPILELHHFSNPTFRGGVLIMTVVGVMLYSLIFMIPIFVSTVQGLTAAQTANFLFQALWLARLPCHSLAKPCNALILEY